MLQSNIKQAGRSIKAGRVLDGDLYSVTLFFIYLFLGVARNRSQGFTPVGQIYCLSLSLNPSPIFFFSKVRPCGISRADLLTPRLLDPPGLVCKYWDLELCAVMLTAPFFVFIFLETGSA